MQETGLDQYAIVKFAEALEVVPRTIAENSGLPATEAVAALYAAHAAGQTGAGLDIETGVWVGAGGGGERRAGMRCFLTGQGVYVAPTGEWR
jgi:chaperonin GroEL (HSP60 family)